MLRAIPAFMLCFATSACVDDQSSLPDEVGTTTAALAFGNVSNSIQVKTNGMCMVAPASGNGGAVTQAPCRSTDTHWWKIVQSPVDPGFYYIENIVGTSHRCLDVPSFPGSSSMSGLALQVFTCHRRGNQLFAVTRTANGEWKIQPKLGLPANLCLDVAWGDNTIGRPLQQFTCKTTDVANQRFLAVPQQQEPDFVGCDNDDGDEFMRVRTASETFTMYPHGIVNFFAKSFAYGCNDLDPTDSYNCPTGTNLIELNWTYADEFRVKCGRR